MCGIAGFFYEQAGQRAEESRRELERMCDCLRHRGPDEGGLWLDPSGKMALGHRRLSILDLSPTGSQPMASASGRYHLAYNGEVYNFRELHQILEARGHQFRGTSDTEVLLAAFEEWGPESTLTRVNGMFALALWDSAQQNLLLARDRFGKKPLYYGRIGNRWAFASELKALRALPQLPARLDRRALTLYLRYGYVPCPYSIYEDVYKLPPGSFIWLREPFRPQPLGAWHPEPTDTLENTLQRAVRRRMIADVPLGAFLSGGIDSSLIVALMQESSSNKVRTFSLGFHDDGYDEAHFARQVAERLGTEHTEHYVTAEEAMDVIPLLPSIYDEPFADSSQIPTYLVSKLARQYVTVALSGDGGDELFGGYNRYLWGVHLWNLLRRVPRPVRQLLATVLSRLPIALFQSLLRGHLAYSAVKLTKLVDVMPIASPRELYKALTSAWQYPGLLVKDALEPPSLVDTQPFHEDFVSWMMGLDQRTYLPDDILVKVDRASMAVSLEARSPFLDPNVAALAQALTPAERIHKGYGKYPLRQILYQRLPRDWFERPKAGFSIPLGSWLREGLRPWAEEMLRPISQQGYLNPQPILSRWQQHQKGLRDWSGSLWTVLMFQSWLDQTNQDASRESPFRP